VAGDLDPPLRRSLELAWEAYRSGSFPVGAVVTDPAGRIVAEGRNRIGERVAPPGRLCGVATAHAEVDALAQLPFGTDYRAHTLHTSLEPCLLCRAATMLAGVGRVRFLAPDPFCHGLDAVRDLTLHTRTRHPHVSGPSDGIEAAFSATLAMATVVASNEPDAAHLADHDRLAPSVMAAARRIVGERRWPPARLDLDGAIEHLRPLLAPS
jgi:tRNA(Arg) A34 adenosine deaminase TadA